MANRKYVNTELQALFGARLREARTKRGMSQEWLALEAGVSPLTIRNYEEYMTHTPMFMAVVSLARVLGVSIDWLAGIGPNRRIPLDDIEWIKEEAV